LLFAAVALLVAITLVVIGSRPEQPSTAGAEQPAAQQAFLARIAQAQAAASDSSNALAQRDVLQSRDQDLAGMAEVASWIGVVRGVQSMQDKAAVSIEFGGVRIVAGVHLSYGLDTLIAPQNAALYNALLTLKPGDEVIFSGMFMRDNGALVEISYTDHGAVSAPEYLFSFANIEPR
jgi:hypothetical protein